MASEIKQLRSSAIEGIARSLEAEGSLCSGVIARDIVDSLISTSRAEGVAAERERIRIGSEYEDCHDDERWCGRPDGDPAKAFWIVPASVLSPAPKEKK